MSAFGLGDEVVVGKSKTKQKVAGIATEKDAAGNSYLMVTVENGAGNQSRVEGSRLSVVKSRCAVKASEIMHDKNFPHGTREGRQQGCKGSHCPGEELVGMTCEQIGIRYASDLDFKRRLDGGMSVRGIPDEYSLTEAPAADRTSRFGTKREQVKQVGNAVTPPVARNPGLAVAEALNNSE
jgi:site-specific DNA-cytosine methylase